MAELVTNQMLDQISVTADWDGLAALLVQRYRGVADRLMPYGVAGDWHDHPERAERWRAVAAAVAAAS